MTLPRKFDLVYDEAFERWLTWAKTATNEELHLVYSVLARETRQRSLARRLDERTRPIYSGPIEVVR